MLALVYFFIAFFRKEDYGVCVQRSSALPYMANDLEGTIRVCIEDVGWTLSKGDILPQGNILLTEIFNVSKPLKVFLNKLTYV